MNDVNLLKSTSRKGFVHGLKLILHQNYFSDNYVENLLDNYSSLKKQFKGKKESLIIPHGILYGLYFYETRRNYFNGLYGIVADNINNFNPLNQDYWMLGKIFQVPNKKSSTKEKTDLKELEIYYKSMRQELKAQIPPKDAFNMYMIAACLIYLLNPSKKREYHKSNIIFIHLATIAELADLKTIKSYTSTKMFLELLSINQRVRRYISKEADFVGEIPNIFQYSIPAESEYFPFIPWMNEHVFSIMKKYRVKSS